jgi:hypothetical protein
VLDKLELELELAVLEELELELELEEPELAAPVQEPLLEFDELALELE